MAKCHFQRLVHISDFRHWRLTQTTLRICHRIGAKVMANYRHTVQLNGRFGGTFSEYDCRTHIPRPALRNRSPELNRLTICAQ